MSVHVDRRPDERAKITAEEVTKIELEHARCISDVENDSVFHLITHDRAYSFAAANTDERQTWTHAICPCIHDASLVQASALDRTCATQQAGYLVLAARTGRGKNLRVDLDVSKWKLQWWSLSQDDTLDCFHVAPSTGSAAAGHVSEQSFDLLGAEVAQGPPIAGLPPSFEVTLSGTKLGKSVAGGGEKLRLFCTNEVELMRWLIILQSAIKRSRDPGSTKKGFLTKESQSDGVTAIAWKHWFVVKSGAVRVYSKPTDAAGDALDELDLRDATVTASNREGAKGGERIVLQTAHQTVGLIAADGEEQRQWIEVLQKNIDAIAPDVSMTITQQGYLQKKSGGLVEKTESRWFTLHHGRLSCFKHEKDVRPRFFVDLTEQSSVALSNTSTGSSLDFTVKTATASDHKVVCLTAANANDLEMWVSCFRSVIAAATAKSKKRGPRKPSVKRGRSPSCPNVLDLTEKSSEHTKELMLIKGEAESLVPVKRRPRLKTRDLTAKMQKEHGAAAHEHRIAQREGTDNADRRASYGGDTAEMQVSIGLGVPTAELGRYETSIVIDLGSQFIRAGFSGELAPRVVVPTSMMTTTAAAEAGLRLSSEAFGWEAENLLQLNSNAQAESILPRGSEGSRSAAQEVDWYGAVLPMLRHVFAHELQVDPTEHGVVVIKPTCMSNEDMEDFLDVMFDDLQVPKLTVQPTAPLALVAAHTGASTGLVLSWGNTLQITPVCDGVLLLDKERTVRFGGAEVTAFLAQLLESERGVSLRRDGLSLDQLHLRKLKEQYAYVAEDFATQKESAAGEIICALGQPDPVTGIASSTVALDAELFTCAELLFDPAMGGHDVDGVHEIIADVIGECPIDYRADLMRHVVIVGGNTCFPGKLRKTPQSCTQAQYLSQHAAPSVSLWSIKCL